LLRLDISGDSCSEGKDSSSAKFEYFLIQLFSKAGQQMPCVFSVIRKKNKKAPHAPAKERHGNGNVKRIFSGNRQRESS